MKTIIISALTAGGVALAFMILVYVATLVAVSDYHEAQPEPTQPTRVILPATSEEVEKELNQFRTERGLAPYVTDNAILDQAAQARAEQMCAENDWSHDKAWTVLKPYYAYTVASENLFYDYLKENQAAQAIETWAESPGHLENLLKPHAQASVGVKYCPGFQGYTTAVIITNYFGDPR